MDMKDLQSRNAEWEEIYLRLTAEGAPPLTAMVHAGDEQSARWVSALVRDGKPAVEAVWLVGSYARFDWAVKNLAHDDLLRLLPELWVASDPDDTRPEYLALWREAWERNGRRTIWDDSQVRLPGGRITVYRRQVGERVGISWTLNRSIAEKFARTGGGRQAVQGGRVLRRRIKCEQALAYLTTRNEQEVILDVELTV